MGSAVLDSCAAIPAHSVLAHIGNTPLLLLERLSSELPGIEIYMKDESRNPGGSVKDRAALSMIPDGERSDKLDAGKIILDATSGNTGIAYAMIGAAVTSATNFAHSFDRARSDRSPAPSV